jgi:hypothetical protein
MTAVFVFCISSLSVVRKLKLLPAVCEPCMCDMHSFVHQGQQAIKTCRSGATRSFGNSSHKEQLQRYHAIPQAALAGRVMAAGLDWADSKCCITRARSAPGPRRRHVELPGLCQEAQPALLVAPHSAEQHDVLLLALEGIQGGHLQWRNAEAVAGGFRV